MRREIKSLAAFFTVICFSVTQFGNTAVAGTPSEIPAEARAASRFDLTIPADLGTINSISRGDGPTIIHIQTAHGNYQAQKKIQGLLHYLKKTYGIEQVYVEGSAMKLQPEILRLFPNDMPLTMEIADSLTKKALLKGAELFLLEDSSVSGQGIENLDAYRVNRESFKAVLTQQEKTSGFVRDMDIQIERFTSPYLNKDLRAFLKRFESYEAEQVSLEDWIDYLRTQAAKYLDVDLANAAYQIDWPMLVRIFKLQQFEAKIDQAAYEKERSEFLKAIRRFLPQNIDRRIEKILTVSHSQQSLLNPDTELLFEHMIQLLPPNFNYEPYPNVKLFIGHLILRSEIKTDILASEMDRLANLISGKLAKTEIEKKILVLLNDHRLLKKLFSLELTPEEYEKITAKNESLRPSLMIQQFFRLNNEKRAKGVTFSHIEEIDSLFEKAVEFYHGAKDRDHWMTENITNQMKRSNVQKAVVITGGFHAQPFKNYFEKNGFNYATISPKINEIGPRDAYLHSILQNTPNLFVTSTLESDSILLSPDQIAMHGSNPRWLAGEVAAAGIESLLGKGQNISRLNQTRHAALNGYQVKPRFANEKSFIEISFEAEPRQNIAIFLKPVSSVNGSKSFIPDFSHATSAAKVFNEGPMSSTDLKHAVAQWQGVIGGVKVSGGKLERGELKTQLKNDDRAGVYPGNDHGSSFQRLQEATGQHHRVQSAWDLAPFLMKKPTANEAIQTVSDISLIHIGNAVKKLLANAAPKIIENAFSIARWIKSLLSSVKNFLDRIKRILNKDSYLVNKNIINNKLTKGALEPSPTATPRSELRKATPEQVEAIRKMLKDYDDDNLVGVVVAPGQDWQDQKKLQYSAIRRRGQSFMLGDNRDFELQDLMAQFSFIYPNPAMSLYLTAEADSASFQSFDMALGMIFVPAATLEGVTLHGADPNQPMFPDWTVITRTSEQDRQYTDLIETRLALIPQKFGRRENRKEIEDIENFRVELEMLPGKVQKELLRFSSGWGITALYRFWKVFGILQDNDVSLPEGFGTLDQIVGRSGSLIASQADKGNLSLRLFNFIKDTLSPRSERISESRPELRALDWQLAPSETVMIGDVADTHKLEFTYVQTIGEDSSFVLSSGERLVEMGGRSIGSINGQIKLKPGTFLRVDKINITFESVQSPFARLKIRTPLVVLEKSEFQDFEKKVKAAAAELQKADLSLGKIIGLGRRLYSFESSRAIQFPTGVIGNVLQRNGFYLPRDPSRNEKVFHFAGIFLLQTARFMAVQSMGHERRPELRIFLHQPGDAPENKNPTAIIAEINSIKARIGTAKDLDALKDELSKLWFEKLTGRKFYREVANDYKAAVEAVKNAQKIRDEEEIKRKAPQIAAQIKAITARVSRAKNLAKIRADLNNLWHGQLSGNQQKLHALVLAEYQEAKQEIGTREKVLKAEATQKAKADAQIITAKIQSIESRIQNEDATQLEIELTTLWRDKISGRRVSPFLMPEYRRVAAAIKDAKKLQGEAKAKKFAEEIRQIAADFSKIEDVGRAIDEIQQRQFDKSASKEAWTILKEARYDAFGIIATKIADQTRQLLQKQDVSEAEIEAFREKIDALIYKGGIVGQKAVTILRQGRRKIMPTLHERRFDEKRLQAIADLQRLSRSIPRNINLGDLRVKAQKIRNSIPPGRRDEGDTTVEEIYVEVDQRIVQEIETRLGPLLEKAKALQKRIGPESDLKKELANIRKIRKEIAKMGLTGKGSRNLEIARPILNILAKSYRQLRVLRKKNEVYRAWEVIDLILARHPVWLQYKSLARAVAHVHKVAKQFTTQAGISSEANRALIQKAASFEIKRLKGTAESRRSELRTHDIEYLTDVTPALKSLWSDVATRVLTSLPAAGFSKDGPMLKGAYNPAKKHQENTSLSPVPPEGSAAQRPPWMMADDAKQLLFKLKINNRGWRMLVPDDASMPYESLLVPDKDVDLVLTDFETNFDMLTFHRKTGLRGFINSLGLGGIRRIHDHVVEDLPIFSLPVQNLYESAGVRFGELENYAGTTLVLESRDDLRLAAEMVSLTEKLLSQKIPHHVFIKAGKVIFVLRDDNPSKLFKIEDDFFNSFYLSTLFFGGVVTYPANVLNRITPEVYNQILEKLSFPKLKRNILLLPSRPELRTSVLGLNQGLMIGDNTYVRFNSWGKIRGSIKLGIATLDEASVRRGELPPSAKPSLFGQILRFRKLYLDQPVLFLIAKHTSEGELGARYFKQVFPKGNVIKSSEPVLSDAIITEWKQKILESKAVIFVGSEDDFQRVFTKPQRASLDVAFIPNNHFKALTRLTRRDTWFPPAEKGLLIIQRSPRQTIVIDNNRIIIRFFDLDEHGRAKIEIQAPAEMSIRSWGEKDPPEHLRYRSELRLQEKLYLVDDNDAVIGEVTRTAAHQPPYPTYRGVAVLVLAPTGEIVFQRHALFKDQFPGDLELFAGHVKLGEDYADAAYREIGEESPFQIRREQLKLIQAPDGRNFFKIRSPKNNVNFEIFRVQLDLKQFNQINPKNDELRQFWRPIYQQASKKLGIGMKEFNKQMRGPRKAKIRDAVKQALIEQVGEDALERYEVEEYVVLPLHQARKQYRSGGLTFGDSFYLLIDPTANQAPEAKQHYEILEQVIETASNARAELRTNEQSREKVTREVREIFAEQSEIAIDQVPMDDELDSLDMAYLVLALEDDVFKIPDEDAENFQTLTDVVNYLLDENDRLDGFLKRISRSELRRNIAGEISGKVFGGDAYRFVTQGTKDSRKLLLNHRIQSTSPDSWLRSPRFIDSQGEPNQTRVNDNADREVNQIETLRNDTSQDQRSQDNGAGVNRDLLNRLQLFGIQFFHSGTSPSLYVGLRVNEFFYLVNIFIINNQSPSTRAELRSKELLLTNTGAIRKEEQFKTILASQAESFVQAHQEIEPDDKATFKNILVSRTDHPFLSAWNRMGWRSPIPYFIFIATMIALPWILLSNAFHITISFSQAVGVAFVSATFISLILAVADSTNASATIRRKDLASETALRARLVSEWEQKLLYQSRIFESRPELRLSVEPVELQTFVRQIEWLQSLALKKMYFIDEHPERGNPFNGLGGRKNPPTAIDQQRKRLQEEFDALFTKFRDETQPAMEKWIKDQAQPNGHRKTLPSPLKVADKRFLELDRRYRTTDWNFYSLSVVTPKIDEVRGLFYQTKRRLDRTKRAIISRSRRFGLSKAPEEPRRRAELRAAEVAESTTLKKTEFDGEELEEILELAGQNNLWGYGTGHSYDEPLSLKTRLNPKTLNQRRHDLIKIIIAQKINKPPILFSWRLGALVVLGTFSLIALLFFLTTPALLKLTQPEAQKGLLIFAVNVLLSFLAVFMLEQNFYGPFKRWDYFKRPDKEGPYWVILDSRFKGAETAGPISYLKNLPHTLARYRFYFTGIPAEYHLAYLVPDRHLSYIEQEIRAAVNAKDPKKRLSNSAAQMAVRRLVTFSQFKEAKGDLSRILRIRGVPINNVPFPKSEEKIKSDARAAKLFYRIRNVTAIVLASAALITGSIFGGRAYLEYRKSEAIRIDKNFHEMQKVFPAAQVLTNNINLKAGDYILSPDVYPADGFRREVTGIYREKKTDEITEILADPFTEKLTRIPTNSTIEIGKKEFKGLLWISRPELRAEVKKSDAVKKKEPLSLQTLRVVNVILPVAFMFAVIAGVFWLLNKIILQPEIDRSIRIPAKVRANAKQIQKDYPTAKRLDENTTLRAGDYVFKTLDYPKGTNQWQVSGVFNTAEPTLFRGIQLSVTYVWVVPVKDGERVKGGGTQKISRPDFDKYFFLPSGKSNPQSESHPEPFDKKSEEPRRRAELRTLDWKLEKKDPGLFIGDVLEENKIRFSYLGEPEEYGTPNFYLSAAGKPVEINGGYIGRSLDEPIVLMGEDVIKIGDDIQITIEKLQGGIAYLKIETPRLVFKIEKYAKFEKQVKTIAAELRKARFSPEELSRLGDQFLSAKSLDQIVFPDNEIGRILRSYHLYPQSKDEKARLAVFHFSGILLLQAAKVSEAQTPVRSELRRFETIADEMLVKDFAQKYLGLNMRNKFGVELVRVAGEQKWRNIRDLLTAMIETPELFNQLFPPDRNAARAERVETIQFRILAGIFSEIRGGWISRKRKSEPVLETEARRQIVTLFRILLKRNPGAIPAFTFSHLSSAYLFPQAPWKEDLQNFSIKFVDASELIQFLKEKPLSVSFMDPRINPRERFALLNLFAVVNPEFVPLRLVAESTSWDLKMIAMNWLAREKIISQQGASDPNGILKKYLDKGYESIGNILDHEARMIRRPAAPARAISAAATPRSELREKQVKIEDIQTALRTIQDLKHENVITHPGQLAVIAEIIREVKEKGFFNLSDPARIARALPEIGGHKDVLQKGIESWAALANSQEGLPAFRIFGKKFIKEIDALAFDRSYDALGTFFASRLIAIIFGLVWFGWALLNARSSGSGFSLFSKPSVPLTILSWSLGIGFGVSLFFWVFSFVRVEKLSRLRNHLEPDLAEAVANALSRNAGSATLSRAELRSSRRDWLKQASAVAAGVGLLSIPPLVSGLTSESEVQKVANRLRKIAEEISDPADRKAAFNFINYFKRFPVVNSAPLTAATSYPNLVRVAANDKGVISAIQISRDFAMYFPPAVVRAALIHEGSYTLQQNHAQHARAINSFTDEIKRTAAETGKADVQTIAANPKILDLMIEIIRIRLKHEVESSQRRYLILKREITAAGGPLHLIEGLSDEPEAQHINTVIRNYLNSLSKPDESDLKTHALENWFERDWTKEGRAFEANFFPLFLKIAVLKTDGLVSRTEDKTSGSVFKVIDYVGLLEWIENYSSITPRVELPSSRAELRTLLRAKTPAQYLALQFALVGIFGASGFGLLKGLQIYHQGRLSGGVPNHTTDMLVAAAVGILFSVVGLFINTSDWKRVQGIKENLLGVFSDYYQLLSEADDFSAEKPAVFLLLGNPDLRTFLEFARQWRESYKGTPIVLAGGRGRGTVPLIQSTLTHYKGSSLLSADDRELLERGIHDATVYETVVLRIILKAEGISQNFISAESAPSKNTAANFQNSRAAINEIISGLKSPVIALVTNPALLKRVQPTALREWKDMALDARFGRVKRFKAYDLDLRNSSNQELIDLISYVSGYPDKYTALYPNLPNWKDRNELKGYYDMRGITLARDMKPVSETAFAFEVFLDFLQPKYDAALNKLVVRSELRNEDQKISTLSDEVTAAVEKIIRTEPQIDGLEANAAYEDTDKAVAELETNTALRQSIHLYPGESLREYADRLWYLRNVSAVGESVLQQNVHEIIEWLAQKVVGADVLEEAWNQRRTRDEFLRAISLVIVNENEGEFIANVSTHLGVDLSPDFLRQTFSNAPATLIYFLYSIYSPPSGEDHDWPALFRLAVQATAKEAEASRLYALFRRYQMPSVLAGGRRSELRNAELKLSNARILIADKNAAAAEKIRTVLHEENVRNENITIVDSGGEFWRHILEGRSAADKTFHVIYLGEVADGNTLDILKELERSRVIGEKQSPVIIYYAAAGKSEAQPIADIVLNGIENFQTFLNAWHQAFTTAERRWALPPISEKLRQTQNHPFALTPTLREAVSSKPGPVLPPAPKSRPELRHEVAVEIQEGAWSIVIDGETIKAKDKNELSEKLAAALQVETTIGFGGLYISFSSGNVHFIAADLTDVEDLKRALLKVFEYKEGQINPLSAEVERSRFPNGPRRLWQQQPSLQTSNGPARPSARRSGASTRAELRMLELWKTINEAIDVGHITIKIADIKKDVVELGIGAARNVAVYRTERGRPFISTQLIKLRESVKGGPVLYFIDSPSQEAELGAAHFQKLFPAGVVYRNEEKVSPQIIAKWREKIRRFSGVIFIGERKTFGEVFPNSERYVPNIVFVNSTYPKDLEILTLHRAWFPLDKDGGLFIINRKYGETITIEGGIFVKILQIEKNLVRLGIQAPPDIPIRRRSFNGPVTRIKEPPDAHSALNRSELRVGDAVRGIPISAEYGEIITTLSRQTGRPSAEIKEFVDGIEQTQFGNHLDNSLFLPVSRFFRNPLWVVSYDVEEQGKNLAVLDLATGEILIRDIPLSTPNAIFEVFNDVLAVLNNNELRVYLLSNDYVAPLDHSILEEHRLTGVSVNGQNGVIAGVQNFKIAETPDAVELLIVYLSGVTRINLSALTQRSELRTQFAREGIQKLFPKNVVSLIDLFLDGIVPFPVLKALLQNNSPANAAKIVGGVLGRDVYAAVIEAEPANRNVANVARRISVEGAPIFTENFFRQFSQPAAVKTSSVSKATATGEGRVVIDYELLRILAKKNPRALYLLLASLERLQGSRPQPFFTTIIPSEVTAEDFKINIVNALQNKKAQVNERSEINWLIERFRNGSLLGIIHPEHGETTAETINKLNENNQGGVAYFGKTVIAGFRGGARFMIQGNVDESYLPAVVAAALLSKLAADQIRGLRPELQAAVLGQFVADHLPGFQAGAEGYALQAIEVLRQALESANYLSTMA